MFLKGKVYANNSNIFLNDIGERFRYNLSPGEVHEDGSLHCVTDLSTCCVGSYRYNREGHWFYPNGTEVRVHPFIYWEGAAFYRNRGNHGTVHLNRANNNVTPTTGIYCCVVPDINRTEQTQCANIGK